MEFVFAKRLTLSDGTPGSYTGDTHIVISGVGELAHLQVGNLFRGRDRAVLDLEEDDVMAGVVTQHTGARPIFGPTIEVPSRRRTDDRPGRYPGEAYPIGEVGAKMPVFQIGVMMAGWEGRPIHCLLPAMELVRYLWAPSSEFIKRLFDRRLGSHPIPRESIFDAKESKWFDESSGHFLLESLRPLSSSEEKAALQLCIIPSVADAWNAIPRTLQSKNIALRPAFVELPFPLPTGLPWTFRFRRVGFKDPRQPDGMSSWPLITEILEVQNTLASVKVVEQPKWNRKRRDPEDSAKTRLRQVFDTAEQAQGHSGSGIPTGIHVARAIKVPDIQQVSYKRIFTRRERLAVISTIPVSSYFPVTSTSSSDAGYASNGMAPASIRADLNEDTNYEPDPRTPDGRLSAFIEIVARLNNHYPVNASLIERSTLDPFWHYPCARGISWGRLDLAGNARRAAISHIFHDGKHMYAIESEVRRKSDVAIGIIYIPGRALDRDEIQQLLHLGAMQRGVWTSLNEKRDIWNIPYRFARVIHPESPADDDTAHLQQMHDIVAARIFAVISGMSPHTTAI